MINLSKSGFTTIKAEVDPNGTIKTKLVQSTQAGMIKEGKISEKGYAVPFDIKSSNYKSSLYSIPVEKSMVSLNYNEAKGKFGVDTKPFLP